MTSIIKKLTNKKIDNRYAPPDCINFSLVMDENPKLDIIETYRLSFRASCMYSRCIQDVNSEHAYTNALILLNNEVYGDLNRELRELLHSLYSRDVQKGIEQCIKLIKEYEINE